MAGHDVMVLDGESLPGVACSGCGRRGTVSRYRRTGRETVRGVPVTVTKTLRGCMACGGEWQHSRDPDWFVDAYAAYRSAVGWTTPEAMRAWREGMGFTADEAAAWMGLPATSLARYERGSLQTPAHEALIARALAGRGLAA